MCDHLLTNRHGDLLVCATCGRSRVLPSVERAFFLRLSEAKRQPGQEAAGPEGTESADKRPHGAEVPR